MTFLEFEAFSFDEKYKMLIQLSAILMVEPRLGGDGQMCNLVLTGRRDPLAVWGTYKEIRERILAAQQAIV